MHLPRDCRLPRQAEIGSSVCCLTRRKTGRGSEKERVAREKIAGQDRGREARKEEEICTDDEHSRKEERCGGFRERYGLKLKKVNLEPGG